MIASIFNKSKPINIVLAGLIVLISFLGKQIISLEAINIQVVGKLLFATSLVIFTIFAVDFIAKKNALSDQNSFVILLYVLMFSFFDLALENIHLLVANAFVLLGLRKIISLKSELNTTKKIFDAAFWIGIASLFYAASIIYLLVLYVGILMYASSYYKNYLVPFVSLFVVFVISSVYQLYFFGDISLLQEISFTTIMCFDTLINKVICILFITLIVAGLFLMPAGIREKTKKNKSTYLLVSIILLIGVLLLFLANSSSISVLVFLYFPLACLLSLILEKFETTIQSIMLYVFILFVIGINFL